MIATRTLQFIAPSCGLATGRALAHVGQLQVHALDIADGCFEQVPVAAWQLRSSSLAEFLHPRGRDSHKGDNGHVLCIGGDHGSGGAIILCAQAALRCGAGLVSVATRGAHLASLLARVPEAMVHALDRTDIENVLFERANVVAIGTGLGQAPWAQALFDGALASGKPLVLDADALNLLARQPRRLPSGTILTPHPGEAARLLGCDTRQVQDDRYAAARRLVEVFGCVVVLKGAGTVVAAPGEIPRVIDAGNPGMGVGGMGDLLTGVIAALSAQGLPAFDAACCGALLHATAGDAAAGEGGERGLLPSDLLTWLRRLANPGSRP